MEYDYEKIICDLNSGKIKQLRFCVDNYAHYKNCFIKTEIVQFPSGGRTFQISVNLTKDSFEKVAFLKSFKEDYKLFHITGKGTFTLKQMWSQIRILEITE